MDVVHMLTHIIFQIRRLEPDAPKLIELKQQAAFLRNREAHEAEVIF
jgi:hypothetical protein